MKQITRRMLKIYVPVSNLDWLNYKLIRSKATFHHIQKKVDGGKTLIENGAILMPVSHEYIHLIECKDIDTYTALNKILKHVNEQNQEPTLEQRQIVEYLFTKFEIEHIYDKRSNGKPLIKEIYLDREKL